MFFPFLSPRWFKSVPGRAIPMPAKWQGWAITAALFAALLASGFIPDNDLAWIARVGLMVAYYAMGIFLGGADDAV